MNKRFHKFAGTGIAIVVVVLVPILALPGASQTNRTVVTRSWSRDAQPSSMAAATTTPSATTSPRPALVRDVDGADRQTILTNFWTQFGGLGDGGGGCGTGFGVLPSGGRIIVEMISVKIVSPTQLQGPYIAVGTSKTGSLSADESASSAIHFGLQFQGIHYLNSTSTAYHYVASQPVHLRIAEDDWLCESLYTGSNFVNGTAHISYFGYVIPAP